MILELNYTAGKLFMTHCMLCVAFNMVWVQNCFLSKHLQHLSNKLVKIKKKMKDSLKSCKKNFIMNTSLLPKAPLRGFVFACILVIMLLEKHCYTFIPLF